MSRAARPSRPVGQDKFSREKGSIRKKWKDQLPVALVFPSTYQVGMSNLGLQIVYSLLNQHSHIVCERLFWPESAGLPVSVESGRPLADFPVIFCSIGFEQDFIHLLQMLHLAGIEPRAARRRERHAQQLPGSPLLVGGGVAVAINPEPLAPYFDLMMIGEAEPVLPDLLDLLVDNWSRRDRLGFLTELATHMPGCYVPDLYDVRYDQSGALLAMTPRDGVPAKVRRTARPAGETIGHSTIFSPDTEFADMFLAELGRGCSRGCRFCAAGFIYRPPRLWSAEAIIRGLGSRPSDIRRVGLLGMEMASPADLKVIAGHLLNAGCCLSFSSLRADNLSAELLELLKTSGLKSVAIAPDGASERLRRVINKGITEEDVLGAVEALVQAGLSTVKLYFMIGLPTENADDLAEMVRLVLTIKAKILAVGRARGRLSNLTLSVNSFVPKAWTPFQFHPFAAEADLRKKIRYLQKELGTRPNIRVMADPPDRALFQAVLARSDRRLGEALLSIALEQGNWRQLLRAAGLKPEDYAQKERGRHELFPWDIIEHGISRTYLWAEYQRALAAKTTPKCETGSCKRCGVCL